MKHYVHSDSFKTRIGNLHGDWLEKVTGLSHSGRYGGIDLVGDDVAIELKSQLKKYPGPWACNSNDIERFKKENDGKENDWAFMVYELSSSVKDLWRVQDLGLHVVSRQVWFMPFDWINQFPISSPEYSGPFRYANRKAFPKDLVSINYSERESFHVHISCSKLLEKLSKI